METLPYVHPDLTIKESTTKGRLVSATKPIKRGEIVLKDVPHALVPAMLADEPDYLICSRHECYRRIPRHQVNSAPVKIARCAKRCLPEVVWCSEQCRTRDTTRHDLECVWLKKTARQITDAYGDTEFVLMWLIVRILIVRYLFSDSHPTTEPLEPQSTNSPSGDISPHSPGINSHFDRRGWSAVWNLEGDPAYFSPEKIEHWRTMVDNFITNGILQLKYSTSEIVKVICKVETNSFGLYPGVTGQYPVKSNEGRGPYYGGGIYPTAAMFNHSCCPEITHQLDDFGCRIFRAGRDIDVGEECCISYFDLAEFPARSERRDVILKSWSFACDCKRCEEDLEVPDYLRMMDLDI